MLSCAGIVAIFDEVTFVDAKGGVYANFTSVAADPTQGTEKLHFYRTSIYIPAAKEDEAKRLLQKKKVLQIRQGYWSAAKIPSKDGKEFPAHELKTMWNSISVLGWFSNRRDKE